MPSDDYLDLNDIPYPLASFYDWLNKDPEATLTAHQAVVDILARYCSFMHIAAYCDHGNFSPKHDQLIWNLFYENSIRRHFAVGKQLNSVVNNYQHDILGSFREFFRALELPREESDDDEKTEDYVTIQHLVNERNDIAHAKFLPNKAEEARLCAKIREYIKKCLQYSCFRNFTLLAVTEEGREAQLMGVNPLAWQNDHSLNGCQIFARLGDRQFQLRDLIILQRLENENHNSIGVFYKQRENPKRRDYTPIRLGGIETEFSIDGSIPVPWPTVDIQRRIGNKKYYYKGDKFKISLKVINKSFGPVELRNIVEHLPDNMRSFGDKSNRVVIPGFTVAQGEKLTKHYLVEATALGTKSFAKDTTVDFAYDSLSSKLHSAPVQGHCEVEVREERRPVVRVEREIVTRSGEPLDKGAVDYDDELIVNYKVYSAGAPTGKFHLVDQVTGAKTLQGRLKFFTESLGPARDQKPVEKSYVLRVTGRERFQIKTELVKQPDSAKKLFPKPIDVIDLPIIPKEDPELLYRWVKVKANPQSRDNPTVSASFALLIKNVGGSSAYALSANTKKPPEVTVRGRVAKDVLPAYADATFHFDVEFPRTIFARSVREKPQFVVLYKSASDDQFSLRIPIPIGKFIESDLESLLPIGRETVQTAARRFVHDQSPGHFLNLYGKSGAGKNYILHSILQESEPNLLYLSQDCRDVTSFADAMSQILKQAMFGMESERLPSATQLEQSLSEVGISREEYSIAYDNIAALIFERRKSSDATWQWVAFFLRRLAHQKENCNRVAVMLGDVDSLGEVSLLEVAQFHREMLPDVASLEFSPVVLLTTSSSELSHPNLKAKQLEVEFLTEEDCRVLVNSVFVFPPASHAFMKRILDYTGNSPQEIVSLLENIVAQRDSLLEFDPFTGVSISNEKLFEEMPKSLDESLSEHLKELGVPEVILTCLGEAPIPLKKSELELLLNKAGHTVQDKIVEEALARLAEADWLSKTDADEVKIKRRSQRILILKRSNKDTVESLRRQLFLYMLAKEDVPELWLPKLLCTERDFVRKNEPHVLAGLHILLENGRYRLFRELASRAMELVSPENVIAVQVLLAELLWNEKKELEIDAKTVEAIARIRDGALRRDLNMRISLLRSAEWLRKLDVSRYDRGAIDIRANAIKCAEGLPDICPLRVKNDHLKQRYLLRLWELYYLDGREWEFRKVDRLIWKRLNRNRDGREIMRYLKHLLSLHTKHRSDTERCLYLKNRVRERAGELTERSSIIEPLTRMERVEESFIGKLLEEPESFQPRDRLLLGRLLQTTGVKAWNSLTQEAKFAQEPDRNDFGIHSRMFRAVEIFRDLGAHTHWANAEHEIGDTFVELLKLAIERNNTSRREPLRMRALDYMEKAIHRFDSMGAVSLANQAWFSKSNCLTIWAEQAEDAEKDRAQLELIENIETMLNRQGMKEQLPVHEMKRWNRIVGKALADQRQWSRAEPYLVSAAENESEVAAYRIFVRLQQLDSGEIELDDSVCEQYEADLNQIRKLILDQSTPDIVGDTDIRQLYIELLWQLSCYHAESSQAQQGLTRLREWWETATSLNIDADSWQEALQLLARLWSLSPMAASEIVSDFQHRVLPLVDTLGASRVEATITQVAGGDPGNFKNSNTRATLEMRLLLGEHLHAKGDYENALRVLSQATTIVSKNYLPSIAEQELIADSLMRALAKAVAAIMHLSHEGYDGDFWESLLGLTDKALYENAIDAFLLFQIELLSSVEDLYQATGDKWFHELAIELSDKLDRIHPEAVKLAGQLSTDGHTQNTLSVILRLVDLYLQLPGRLVQAIELLECVCEGLLHDENYVDLPLYLSFLRDLVGSALHSSNNRKKQLADLHRRSIEEEEDSLYDEEAELRDADTVGKAAEKLCAKVLQHIGESCLNFETTSRIVYYAPDLLKDDNTADLNAAVHTKLYEMESQVATSNVWAVYNAWTSAHPPLSSLPTLQDKLALTCLANMHAEDETGRPTLSIDEVRNYLITARNRNSILAEWCAEDADNPRVYYYLEIERMKAVHYVMRSLEKTLEKLGGITRTSFITFLYGYVLPTEDQQLPEWEKVKLLTDYVPEHESEIHEFKEKFIRYLDSTGVWDIEAYLGTDRRHSKHVEATKKSYDSDCSNRYSPIEEDVAAVIRRFRLLGRNCMQDFCERIQPYSLESILDELSSYLECGTRTIDYNSILQLWPEEPTNFSYEVSAPQ